MTISDQNLAALIEINKNHVNTDLEPHILTDKDDVKLVGCRTCQRPCVVTRFMAPAKVACNDHRDRKVKADAVHEFDRSKETHVLTDKEETKEVPCRSCGRPCIVTRFMSPVKVACNDCRGSVPRPKKRTTWEKSEGSVTLKDEYVALDADAFAKAMEPSIPVWPDGSPADRKELIALAAAEAEIRCTYEDKRAGIFRDYREGRRTRKEGEPLDLSELEPIRTELDDIHARRRQLRQRMVDKLLKKQAEFAYDEVRDEETLKVERIPVIHNLRKLEQAMLV